MKKYNWIIILTVSLLIPLLLTVATCVGDDDDDSGDDDDADGGIWTDPATVLMWEKSPATDPLYWQEAINYCQELRLAGYDDWRLPTIDELRSLIRGCDRTGRGGDCNVTDSCTSLECQNEACDGCNGGNSDNCYLEPALSGSCDTHWSYSTDTEKNCAWYVDFDYRADLVCLDFIHSRSRVRCVRG